MGSYNCTCIQGYSGNGFHCKDVNECMGPGETHKCHADAACSNTPGSYECVCNDGYDGDGFDCVKQADNSLNQVTTTAIGAGVGTAVVLLAALVGVLLFFFVFRKTTKTKPDAGFGASHNVIVPERIVPHAVSHKPSKRLSQKRFFTDDTDFTAVSEDSIVNESDVEFKLGDRVVVNQYQK